MINIEKNITYFVEIILKQYIEIKDYTIIDDIETGDYKYTNLTCFSKDATFYFKFKSNMSKTYLQIKLPDNSYWLNIYELKNIDSTLYNSFIMNYVIYLVSKSSSSGMLNLDLINILSKYNHLIVYDEEVYDQVDELLEGRGTKWNSVLIVYTPSESSGPKKTGFFSRLFGFGSSKDESEIEMIQPVEKYTEFFKNVGDAKRKAKELERLIDTTLYKIEVYKVDSYKSLVVDNPDKTKDWKHYVLKGKSELSTFAGKSK